MGRATRQDYGECLSDRFTEDTTSANGARSPEGVCPRAPRSHLPGCPGWGGTGNAAYLLRAYTIDSSDLPDCDLLSQSPADVAVPTGGDTGPVSDVIRRGIRRSVSTGGKGPHPGIVVCLGVVPFGADHPQVPRL